MYGVLKMAGCGLAAQEREAWWGHLCGLCTGLRKQFGQPARLATNSDAALVIALGEAQAEEPIPKHNSFCVLHRPFTLRVDDPSHPAVRYASGAAMLSAADRLRDNLQDDPGWMRGARRPVGWLAGHWREMAEEYLAALGFQAGLVEGQFQRQAAVEAQVGGDFSVYSQPTELAVGAVFAHTARMQNRVRNYDPLFALGRGYGRIMLLLDAYQDYEQDALRRQFNPLAAAFPDQDWRQAAQDLFHQAHRQLGEAVEALELPNPVLLRHLLLSQLGRTGHRALGLCHAAGAAGVTQGRGGNLRAAFRPPINLNPLPAEEQPEDIPPEPGKKRCCAGEECYFCGDCCYYSSWTHCHCGGCHDCSDGSDCICGNCFDCSNCDLSKCCDSSNCDCSNCDCGNCCDGCNCCDCNL